MIVDGTIRKPISITDIKTVLGVPSNKLSELCTSDKINVYAAFRPLGGGTPTSKPNDPSNAINIQESLYNASDIIPSAPSPGLIWNKAVITKWFRMLDFDGYYHATRAPIYRDKQDYYINTAGSWAAQNKVYIDFANYAGNSLENLAVVTAQGVTIKPYDMYAYMTIYTKSGSNYIPYSTATNHVLSKQKIGSNGNYIEIPVIPVGQYYFTLELDSLAVGNYRYKAGFPLSTTMSKIAGLKVEFIVNMDALIIGYREDWMVQTSYRTETNSDSVNVSKLLVISKGALGLNFKVEVKNLTAAPLTVNLNDFDINTTGNTIFLATDVTTTYPSRDRVGVSDPTTYNSANNTITLPANHITYVNVWARRPITSSTNLPSGTYSEHYQLWYGDRRLYDNSKDFVVS